MKRRDFIKKSSKVLIGASVLSTLPQKIFAASRNPVEEMTLLTSNASFDPVRPEMGRLITQACKKIGWNIKLAAEDYNMGIGKVFDEKDFDMYIVRWTGRANRIDPETFTYMMHHRDGNYNKWGYDNKKVNELCEAQQVEMNAVKRKKTVYEIQKLIYDDAASSVIVYPSMTNAYREDRLQNLVPQVGEGIGSLWTDLSVSTKKGDGYIRTGQTSPLKNLNPISVTDSNEFKELRMIYDRLVQLGPNGEIIPWAATSIKVIDSTTIDIVLRNNMKFHDNRPVTIDDVKFTFEYYRKWKAPFFISSLEKFKSMKISGKNKMRIKLSEPHAPLMINFFAQIFILPQHIWKDIPEKVNIDDVLNYPNEKPIGSGPFKFDYWDQGKELKVTANKSHFNAPKCEGIIRITYGSHDALAAAIETGECDRTRYILKPALVQDLNKVRGVVGKGYPSHGWYGFMFNHLRGPLKDPIFRKAIDHVIPRDVIQQVVMSGFADKGGSVIASANEFWHNPKIATRPYNINKARDILKSGGYSWDNSGKLLYPA